MAGLLKLSTIWQLIERMHNKGGYTKADIAEEINDRFGILPYTALQYVSKWYRDNNEVPHKG